MTSGKTKLLLGGVPFGCDNIGDEAILAGVVAMLRGSLPDVELSVATADPETAGRLGVRVVPPYGFAGAGTDGFAAEAAKCDAYVWCGATGLSDYPGVALDLLDAAQRAGVATFVWGVGMDTRLNPAFFEANGKRRAVLEALHLRRAYERALAARLARRISRIMPRCRGVWLRDAQSCEVLRSFGFGGAKCTADTAMLQSAGGASLANLDAVVSPASPSRGASAPRLGLCISAQRRVADIDGLARLVARVRGGGWSVVGMPMNPKTDRALMQDALGVECIEGSSPEEVCAAAAGCDVVLSSRLHLLVLSANVGTPILGISRGSKLDNWLAAFGRTSEGSVEKCDWDAVAEHVLSEPMRRAEWDQKRREAYRGLRDRFEKARAELVSAIAAAH